MATILTVLFVFASHCIVQSPAYMYMYSGAAPVPRGMYTFSGAAPVAAPAPSSPSGAPQASPIPPPTQRVANRLQMQPLGRPPVQPMIGRPPMPPVRRGPPMPPPIPYNMGPMPRRYAMGGRKRNFRKSPLYLGAKALGCRYGIDAESIVSYIYPKGCTPVNDFCPYKYSGLKRCTRVGSIGMCCPPYVNQETLAMSVQARDMMNMIEMLS